MRFSSAVFLLSAFAGIFQYVVSDDASFHVIVARIDKRVCVPCQFVDGLEPIANVGCASFRCVFWCPFESKSRVVPSSFLFINNSIQMSQCGNYNYFPVTFSNVIWDTIVRHLSRFLFFIKGCCYSLCSVRLLGDDQSVLAHLRQTAQQTYLSLSPKKSQGD